MLEKEPYERGIWISDDDTETEYPIIKNEKDIDIENSDYLVENKKLLNN